MPKILRIINRFNLGGPTYNVAYLTKYLAPEFETLLVGGAKDETEGSSEYIVRSLGIEPVIISEMKREINLLQDRIAYQKIKKIIREYKPDIVHTHASKAGTLGRLAAYNCNVPVIVHTFHGHVFHSYFGKLQTAFYKNIERYLAKKSSAIIAISNKQKNELSNEHHICPAEKIEVIPLGFNLSRFTEAQEEKRKKFRLDYNIANDEVAVGIIGRLVPVKNHKLFVEAIKYINEKSDKKVRAFIVGDGELKEEIIKMAKSTNLTIT
jgi:glycosyltransferase involved in cell wall biosynthesis